MSEENGMEKSDIVKALLVAGCCKRCASRFLGELDSSQKLEENETSTQNDENGTDVNGVKKIKMNPCVICLDLLQDAIIADMVSDAELDGVTEYDSDTFVNYISFPVAILLREHSMGVYIKQKFPQFFKDQYIVPINRAWSLCIQNKLSKRINKTYDKNSNFIIQFTATYGLDKEELSVLSHIQEEVTKINVKDDVFSRTAIGEFLRTSKHFQKYVTVPPQIPTKTVVLEEITYKHEPIFIAGRYCKYSRNLGQTPWIIEKVRVVEGSVQEIIFSALESLFQTNNFVFSASGREDFDVRTLGRGRPFFIKINDPKITKIPPECFRDVEDRIKRTKQIKVQDLQFVDKSLVNNIKDGEEFKKKTYTALCIIDKPENIETYISKINSLQKEIKLQQKTPIRVYHRRSSGVRERVIYEIKARPIAGKNNLFELDLVTQAGTYVKEFVHGDLGRTTPSLCEIIGGQVDVLALDVMDIHLDFPPPINGGNKSNSTV